MKQDHHRRRLFLMALLAALALIVAACGDDDGADDDADATDVDDADTDDPDDDGEAADLDGTEVGMLMNWFAQSEQGGYWQVAAADLGEEFGGFSTTIQEGGPQVQTIPQVAADEFGYGVASSIDQLLVAREQGVPVVAVFAPFDTHPRCLMSHPEAEVEDFSDIDGMQVAVAQASIGFWQFIATEYELDVQEVSYGGGLAEFARNPELVQQCFITSEPYEADQQDIPHDVLLVADSGFNPYGNVLFTTEDRIENDPDEVAAVVEAVVEGWNQYVDEPSEGLELILETNDEMTEEKALFAQEEMQELLGEPIGCMDQERWDTLHGQLLDTGDLSGEVDVEAAYTNEFMPEC